MSSHRHWVKLETTARPPLKNQGDKPVADDAFRNYAADAPKKGK